MLRGNHLNGIIDWVLLQRNFEDLRQHKTNGKPNTFGTPITALILDSCHFVILFK